VPPLPPKMENQICSRNFTVPRLNTDQKREPTADQLQETADKSLREVTFANAQERERVCEPQELVPLATTPTRIILSR
jgi:hypothetical protein